jgi:hypothetical protein
MAAAWIADRHAAEDEKRSRELAEAMLLLRIDAPSDGLCPRGHPLDGVKGHGKHRRRFCRTCNRDRERRARAEGRR